MSIANVSIVGNLVKAPQQVQFQSGKIKTTMVVAVNTPLRQKRGGDAADFYRVETWGKLAELAANRLDKGNQVTANGSLLMDKWTDDKGRERMTPTISATDIAFPQRPKRGEPQEQIGPSEPIQQTETTQQAETIQFSERRALPAAMESDRTETQTTFSQDSESPDAVQESEAPRAADDDDDDDDDYDDDDDGDSYGGEPNNSTKPAPMRSNRAAPG